jgi:hypothetical protein
VPVKTFLQIQYAIVDKNQTPDDDKSKGGYSEVELKP